MKNKIFFILFFILMTFSLNVYSKYPVLWESKKIELTLGWGETKYLKSTFKSDTELQNVDLWVVPELKPYMSLNPNHFEVIEANITYEVFIHFNIPS